MCHVNAINAFRDVATNTLRTELVDAFSIVEQPDVVRSSLGVAAAFFNLSDGTLRLTASKTVDYASKDLDGAIGVMNLTRLNLSQTTGDFVKRGATTNQGFSPNLPVTYR